MKFIAIFFFLILANTASADTYSRLPAGSGTYQNVTISATINDLSACTTDWFVTAVSFNPSFQEISSTPVPISQNSATFVLTSTQNFQVDQITAGCDGAPGSLVSLEYTGLPLFYLENTDSIWGGGSVFGNTTPMQLTASVADGVQNTGVDIWPLFALVGVALAFVVAGMIVRMIKTSVGLRELDQIEIDRNIELVDAKSNMERDRIDKKFDKKRDEVADKYLI